MNSTHYILTALLAHVLIFPAVGQNGKLLEKGKLSIPLEARTKLSAVQSLVDGLGVRKDEDFNRKLAASMAFAETQIRIDGGPHTPPSQYGASNFIGRSSSLNKFIGQSKPGSLATDAEYNGNFRTLVYASQKDDRIMGGTVAGPLDMRDCVAVGDSTRYFATGTLISDQLVLTAAHVARRSRPTKIFIGHSLLEPGIGGREVAVSAVVAADPATLAPDAKADGLLLLILKEKVNDVIPRRLPPSPMPPDYPWGATDPMLKVIRIAGFGANSPDGKTGFGIKRIADVPTAGRLPAIYGFNPELEFAAGFDDLNIDTCKGDSGGPALINLPDAGDWFLVGCTSRSTLYSDQTCGDGGNYLRTDTPKMRQWISDQAKSAGVSFP